MGSWRKPCCAPVPLLSIAFPVCHSYRQGIYSPMLIWVTSEALPDKVSSHYEVIPSHAETLLVRLVLDWLYMTACLLKVSHLHFQTRQIISSFKEGKETQYVYNDGFFKKMSPSSCNIPSLDFFAVDFWRRTAASVYLGVRQLILLWMNTVLWQNSGTAVITAVTH